MPIAFHLIIELYVLHNPPAFSDNIATILRLQDPMNEQHGISSCIQSFVREECTRPTTELSQSDTLFFQFKDYSMHVENRARRSAKIAASFTFKLLRKNLACFEKYAVHYSDTARNWTV